MEVQMTIMADVLSYLNKEHYNKRIIYERNFINTAQGQPMSEHDQRDYDP